MTLRWRDLRRGMMLVTEREEDEEAGKFYWSTTILLTDWGGGDRERGTGFLALTCIPHEPPSVYAYATACSPDRPALRQDWILPRARERL